MNKKNDHIVVPIWLANEVGIYEAIILIKMEKWLMEPDDYKFLKHMDGFHWIEDIFPHMREAYMFLTTDHIRKALRKLEMRSLVMARFFKTKNGEEERFYRINYLNVDRLKEIKKESQ
jgi:tRNA nucleotidyltransferase/poly(A) polymerase